MITIDILDENEVSVEIEETVIRSGDADIYEGPYAVDPTREDQTLETNNKLMADDVVVHAVAYHETANPKGGKTVIIG